VNSPSFAIQVICCWLILLLPARIPVESTPFIKETRVNPTAEQLFGSEEVLNITLSGNIRELFNDRGDKPVYHPLTLSYQAQDSSVISIPVRAKTRGNFRRSKENCTYPPVYLNFIKKGAKPSIFDEQNKLKLVTPCQGEELVFREYLVYKLYNLITPKSFRARLVRVNYHDDARKKDLLLYSMVLEEDVQVAKRNKMRIIPRKMIRGENTETEIYLKMAVFQYMIGNTDWSVPYLHNIRILAFDSLSVPYVVPYDFDHAAIVDAPYALPAEQLGLSSTHERRFRGYCITDFKTFDEVLATFNRLKNDFYNVYTNCKFLNSKYTANTTRFLDKFYETINNSKRAKAELTYPCDHKEDANLIIKGLEND
jgi:hypothetical protein